MTKNDFIRWLADVKEHAKGTTERNGRAGAVRGGQQGVSGGNQLD